AVRGALLKHLRVNATPLARNPNPTSHGLFALTFNAIRRRFCDEVKGSFLDKSEVTDRVISVVKNFQKVDPSKTLWRLSWPLKKNLGSRFLIMRQTRSAQSILLLSSLLLTLRQSRWEITKLYSLYFVFTLFL
ncbi:Mitochondrial acyl carrier protein 2 isoform 2, partial [Theobroma cacao]